MTAQDRHEFELYLKSCTDSQVMGVLEKEREAGRTEYVQLVKQEMARRQLS